MFENVSPEAELVGVAEIADILGLSRQRVNRIVQTHDDFPEPLAELSAGRIWRAEEIEKWMQRTGRTPT
ncbi:MAG: helix-turn-helix domain-containing protein [bacterium]|nr:helix-turn-helix domain-containing protein [bacterium]